MKYLLTPEDRLKLQETKRIGDAAGQKLRDFNIRIRMEREDTLKSLEMIKANSK